jgi:hypothetical protein
MNVPLAGGVVAPPLIEGSISLILLIAEYLLAAPRTKAAAEKSGCAPSPAAHPSANLLPKRLCRLRWLLKRKRF